MTRTASDPEGQAAALLAALLPDARLQPAGLDDAIRLELLITALQDTTCPHSLSELLRVLQRISAGEVAQALVAIVRSRAEAEPDLLLTELGSRRPSDQGPGSPSNGDDSTGSGRPPRRRRPPA